MNKARVITAMLILSILLNAFLLKAYSDGQSHQIELEKAIIMNEFSERAKEWRNFKTFVSKLAEKEDEHFPISEKQSNLYWELATPMKSVIMKVTDKVNPEYISYNEYLIFINKFDLEYKAIVDSFQTKLPSMSKEEVITFANQLDETYNFFMGEAMGQWSVGGGPNLDIRFEPQVEQLNQVTEELALINKELEDI